MKTSFILAIIFACASFGVSGEDKIIYQYKKYEKFDLGDLEIKGDILAPGDLSVNQRGRREFTRKLYDKSDFDRESLDDAQEIR